MGLERGPLSLLSTTEALLERKCSGSGLEIREFGGRDRSRWSCGTCIRKDWSFGLSQQSFFLKSLCLITGQDTKTYWGAEVCIHAFLNSSLDRRE
jgi:hypothetical protein